MRITDNSTVSNSLYYLQQGQARTNSLSEKIATGANINRPSDDPIGTSLLLSINDQIKAVDQETSNITKATTSLNVTSSALQGMSDIMQQATQLADSLSNGSNNTADLASAVRQLTTLKQQMVDMGNTQIGDQYIFGGANNSAPPFNIDNSYNGDSTQNSIKIAQNYTQTLNVTGDQLLQGTGANPSYGSTDILKSFDALITALSATPNNVSGIQAATKDLEAGTTQINNAQTDVASRLVRLTSVTTMNTNIKNTLENVVSNTQTADYAQLGVELTAQQTAFNAYLSSTAKNAQMSLLNYLT